ncbi:MAG: hypothetical protein QOG95_1283, partial [Mycobacterium sp.]|nr:hypothetical protein [Mycobacterium sp.]
MRAAMRSVRFPIYGLRVPEINRRNIMLTMGLGALTAAMRLPEAWAHPSPPDTPAGPVPPPAAPADAAPGA